MNQKRLKVLILINDLLRGGAQRIVADIAIAIDRDRFDLLVVYLKPPDIFSADSKSLLFEMEESGVRIVCAGGGQKFSLAEFFKLVKILKDERPDIIHTFLPYAGILGRIAGRIANVRGILSTQCNSSVSYTTRVYWLDKFSLYLAHAWTAVTEGIEEEYGASISHYGDSLWIQGRRHFTVPSAVNLKKIRDVFDVTNRKAKRAEIGVPDTAHVVMMTARLISWKGQDELIKALRHLPEDTHVVFVGWGPSYESFLKTSRTERVESRVHFLGARSDVYEILATADVFVQAHKHDEKGHIWIGPNIAQLEAAAVGVPSVSTKNPFIEALLEEGVTGTLSRPDDPEDLARAINWVFEHKEAAEKLALSAKKRVAGCYSVERVTRVYESLYESLSDRR